MDVADECRLDELSIVGPIDVGGDLRCARAHANTIAAFADSTSGVSAIIDKSRVAAVAGQISASQPGGCVSSCSVSAARARLA